MNIRGWTRTTKGLVTSSNEGHGTQNIKQNIKKFSSDPHVDIPTTPVMPAYPLAGIYLYLIFILPVSSRDSIGMNLSRTPATSPHAYRKRRSIIFVLDH